MFPSANRVTVSTWDPDTGYDLENFKLQAHAPGDRIYGILCEKGNLLLHNLYNLYNVQLNSKNITKQREPATPLELPRTLLMD